MFNLEGHNLQRPDFVPPHLRGPIAQAQAQDRLAGFLSDDSRLMHMVKDANKIEGASGYQVDHDDGNKALEDNNSMVGSDGGDGTDDEAPEAETTTSALAAILDVVDPHHPEEEVRPIVEQLMESRLGARLTGMLQTKFGRQQFLL